MVPCMTTENSETIPTNTQRPARSCAFCGEWTSQCEQAARLSDRSYSVPCGA